MSDKNISRFFILTEGMKIPKFRRLLGVLQQYLQILDRLQIKTPSTEAKCKISSFTFEPEVHLTV